MTAVAAQAARLRADETRRQRAANRGIHGVATAFVSGCAAAAATAKDFRARGENCRRGWTGHRANILGASGAWDVNERSSRKGRHKLGRKSMKPTAGRPLLQHRKANSA